MATAKKPARLMVRNEGDFVRIVKAYISRTKISPTKLSALSTGDIRFVGHVLNGNASRISLGNVDKVLTFIEQQPEGAA